MKRILTLLMFAAMNFVALHSFAQGSSCATADPFCTGTTYTFNNNSTGTGAGQGPQAQSGPNYGCLLAQPNPAWYYMQILNPGNIDITISQTSGGSGSDVDFICWGPFSSQTGNCGSLTSGNTVDCSYSTAAVETCNIPSAVTGQYYLLLLTNYANTPGVITFNQTGGAGTTNCAVLCSTPNVSTAGTQTLTCSTTSVTLNGTSSTPGVTYSWVGPGGFTSHVANPVVSTAGTYTLTVTDPSNPSCPATAQQTVTLNNTAPNASAGATQNITCTASSVSLSGNSTTAGASYSWSGPGGFTSASQNPSATTAGTYTVTVTNPSNGCTATAQQIVGTNTTPPDATAGAAQNITCTTTSVNLGGNSATSGAAYNWAGPGGFAATSQNPATTTAGTYTLTVTNPANGCTATAQQVVTSNTTPPDASAGAAQNLSCTITTVNLGANSATAGATYSWAGPGGFTDGTQNPAVTIAGTYTVTVTDPANGCTATAQQIVNPATGAPVATTGTAAPLTCSVLSVSLSGSSSSSTSTYSWTGPGSFASTAQNPTVNTAGTYTLTITDTTSGCTATAQETVTATSTPPNATVGAAQNLTCTTLSLSLNGSSTTSNVTYSWAGPGGFTASTTNPTVNTVGTYTLTVTDTTNGCSSTALQTINSNTTPPDAGAGAAQTLTCIAPAANLSGTSVTSGATYSWSGPGGFTSSSQNPVASAAGTYTVTVTDPANGCTATASQVVNPSAGAPNATAGATQMIDCINSSVSLSGTSTTSGVTYSWSGPGGFSSSTANPSVTAAGTYTLTVTDPSNGCTSIATEVVNRNTVLPTVQAGTDQNLGCGSVTTALNAAGTSTGPTLTYNWASTTGTVVSAGTTLTPVVTQGTYTLTVTNTMTGCVSSDVVIVSGVTTPVASFTATPSSGVAPLPVSFVNNSTNAAGYGWSFGEGTTSTLSDPTNTYGTPGSYTVTLIAVSADGCVDTARATIFVDELSVLVVPNVFTPNGDGSNEIFMPVVAKGLKDFKAEVYDRWGLKMFEWSDEHGGWNGKAKNGAPAPDGTYYYIISATGEDGKQYDYKGYVSLMRN